MYTNFFLKLYCSVSYYICSLYFVFFNADKAKAAKKAAQNIARKKDAEQLKQRGKRMANHDISNAAVISAQWKKDSNPRNDVTRSASSSSSIVLIDPKSVALGKKKSSHDVVACLSTKGATGFTSSGVPTFAKSNNLFHLKQFPSANGEQYNNPLAHIKVYSKEEKILYQREMERMNREYSTEGMDNVHYYGIGGVNSTADRIYQRSLAMAAVPKQVAKRSSSNKTSKKSKNNYKNVSGIIPAPRFTAGKRAQLRAASLPPSIPEDTGQNYHPLEVPSSIGDFVDPSVNGIGGLKRKRGRPRKYVSTTTTTMATNEYAVPAGRYSSERERKRAKESEHRVMEHCS